MPAVSRNSRKQPRRQAALSQNAEGARSAKDDALAEFRARRKARQLAELERTNAQDIPNTSFNLQPPQTTSNAAASSSGIPSALALLEESKKTKKKQTSNVKSLLIYRKTLAEYLDELPEDHPYLNAAVGPPKVPARKICSSCGYNGAYACPRCGEYSCSRPCIDVHAAEGGCGIGT